MKKFFSLFIVTLFSVSMWAAQGGTLTATMSPIYPTETVTLTYDGTGTNFANWTPECFIHAWLIDKNDNNLSYGTDWETAPANFGALDGKLKMTLVSQGIYTISMNIKTFFGVADEDLDKIGKLGIIVRAANVEDNDNNKTNDMTLSVAYELYMKNSWGTAEWTWKEMTWNSTNKNFKLENVVFGGGGVNINGAESETGKIYVALGDFEGDAIETNDTVTLVYTPSTGAVTATLLGKYRPTIKLWGAMEGDWTDGDDFVLANDRNSASLSVNFATTGHYRFKVKSNGTALGKSNSGDYNLHSGHTSVSGLGDGAEAINLDVSRTGNYTFTYTFATSTLSVVYPNPTALDNTADEAKAIKRIENGQLVIYKNGVRYNALGAEVK